MIKKGIFLILLTFLLSGCFNKDSEQIYSTCKKDEIQPTYSSSFSIVIKSKDKKAISSIETSAIYNATYTDTDMKVINDKIDETVQYYKQNYKDIISETDEKKEQSFMTISIPINEENLKKFQKELPSIIVNKKLSTSQYRNLLSEQGYTCS